MKVYKEIKVCYHTDTAKAHPLADIKGGDWIDLYTAEEVTMYAGEYREISLGVSISLPEDYEAIVAPRSSTYKKWGLLCANSIGIIDNAYKGQNDVWKFAAICMKATVTIPAGTRICQFRLLRNMPAHEFITVTHLSDESRNGFGSTGD